MSLLLDRSLLLSSLSPCVLVSVSAVVAVVETSAVCVPSVGSLTTSDVSVVVGRPVSTTASFVLSIPCPVGFSGVSTSRTVCSSAVLLLCGLVVSSRTRSVRLSGSVRGSGSILLFLLVVSFSRRSWCCLDLETHSFGL